MNVGKCQASTAAYGTSSGRIGSSASSAVQSGRADSSNPVQASDSPSVVDNIDYGVYSAIDEFLGSSGDERLNSYSSLSDAGKGKFMKVLSKMVEGGGVDNALLDLGESTPAKQSFLNDYVLYSSNTASSYSADGKTLN